MASNDAHIEGTGNRDRCTLGRLNANIQGPGRSGYTMDFILEPTINTTTTNTDPMD